MYFTYIYLLSLMIAVGTVIAGIFIVASRAVPLRVFPKALRLYIIFCYLPVVFCVALVTIAYAVFYIIYGTEELKFISVANTVNSYLTQIVRTFFFIFALERIMATVYVEKYTISAKIWLFLILSLLTAALTVFFITLINYGPIDVYLRFEVYTYVVFGTHLVTIVIFAVLYYLNGKMYKLTAYRISLKKRHQILENLKVIHYIFPSILIYNSLAPFGSVITAFGFWLDLPSLPLSVFHIFHNLPHLIIFLRLLFLNFKKNRNTKVGSVTVVQNVLGKNIPKAFKTDEYFKDLQQQWK